MRGFLKNAKHGYTIIELMVTIVIVAVLAATVGTFVVKLLTIQEQEREEAYICERLADICAIYADFLSLGTNVISIGSYENDVLYRDEAGGVSFETGGRFTSSTGRVSCAAHTRMKNIVPSSQNKDAPVMMSLDIQAFEQGGWNTISQFSRDMRGDDLPLIHPNALKELMISDDNRIDMQYRLRRLGDALWLVQVVAQYRVTYGKGLTKNKTLTAERIVRLWNQL